MDFFLFLFIFNLYVVLLHHLHLCLDNIFNISRVKRASFALLIILREMVILLGIDRFY